MERFCGIGGGLRGRYLFEIVPDWGESGAMLW